MTSITLLNHVNGEKTKQITSDSYPTEYVSQWPTSNQRTKTSRALSYNEEGIQSSMSASNNSSRLKHLCTRLKRRFSISKDYRTRSDDLNKGISVRFSTYKSFSSSVDDTFNEFEWPDFEKVYDSIPPCLARALPGLDDISIRDDDDDNDTIDTNFITDETDEQFELFQECKRGKHFRRNAICRRLDKSQYNGQLDTFIQQLLIEKLMRTWT